MPADSPHPNLCKSILSAVALGFPLPTLLNWSGEFNRPEWHFAGSHIAKLESLLAVIEEMLSHGDDIDGGADDDDLAVLVDAYDIWFQLPPSVLIRRYHQLNDEANERLQKQWQAAASSSSSSSSSSNFPLPPPKQSIIVTTAKDCQPDSESGSSPHYAHWPPSPMPQELYGPETDTVLPLLFDPARKYRKVRPRCINSGMIMGTMSSLRQVLRRCKQKIAAVALSGRQLWSDQALLGEVLGEQEIWREWVTQQLSSSWNGSASTYDLTVLSPEVRDIAAKALAGEQFEFGIGLDYNFTTIPATCSAEEDGYFVQLDDANAVLAESLKAGVPDGPRINSIPKELIDNKDITAAADPLAKVSWGHMPLYTDFFFGVVPVGIHHNAYIDGLKPWRLKNWWSLMWFHPRLRDLVSAHVQPSSEDDGDAEPRPLLNMSSRGDDGGERNLVYWPPEMQQRGKKQVTVFEPRKDDRPGRLVPIDWDGVCQKGSTPWHEELFGDGKGPLEV
ncbi:hypothetical protein BBK36DRAFT_1128877 [Trichoderma citrinoviride]|uniref:Uncharacterized protein n=1 Tax=Trichoderma citrinoviride TaxID=58853 RepID=A0A2T4AZS1_9HYPO|nr:hypothetical protein BBK36DRAFT_1128877 [Trichoderma citrinoviride]PTB62569.1 hypothetical protein BBK36DRAFT_1128877 [Trichoderma citrinoviride]